MTLQEAIVMYQSRFQNRLVSEVLDAGDMWIVAAVDRETKEELDISPTSIDKFSGQMRTFFPPAHAEKLKTATKVFINESIRKQD